MAKKEIENEELFNNFLPSILEHAEIDDKLEKSQKTVFDETLHEERYRKSKVINQGGMKKIHETTDPLTKRLVAKATLIDFKNSEKAESFLSEAWLTAALEHPNIVPIYDIGIDEDQGPYFIMKLVGGKNLSDILKILSSGKDDSDYTLRDLLMIFLKICDAVAYAHSKGIVHLDLKPENIQVGDYGEVLVCDWGLAKIVGQPEDFNDAELDPQLYNNMTLDGFIKGTPGYMAPEQIDTTIGPKNQQSDIYALGGILYSLLCLKAPFESDTVEGLLKETLAGSLLPPSQRSVRARLVPPSLEAVAIKALEREPEDRYEAVTEVITEINKWLDGFATEAENAGFSKSIWLLMNRHKSVSFLLFSLLFSASFGVYKIKQNEKIAISNEKKATVNEKKALQNELKAKDALALYIKEKKSKSQISDQAIEQIKQNNEYFLGRGAFKRALEPIDDILVHQPDNELLNVLKGEIHFYQQEYLQALASFKKAGKHINNQPYKSMFELAPKYAQLLENNEYLKAQDFVDLVLSFKNGTYRGRIYGFETRKFELNNRRFSEYKENLPALHNHIELCRLLIFHDNPKLKTLNFKYKLEDSGINLDLSRNPKLNFLAKIRHLPLSSLNIESTTCWRLWIFSHYHLKSINIKNTLLHKVEVVRLRTPNTKLKEIILTKKQFDNSEINSNVQNRINFIIDE